MDRRSVWLLVQTSGSVPVSSYLLSIPHNIALLTMFDTLWLIWTSKGGMPTVNHIGIMDEVFRPQGICAVLPGKITLQWVRCACYHHWSPALHHLCHRDSASSDPERAETTNAAPVPAFCITSVIGTIRLCNKASPSNF